RHAGVRLRAAWLRRGGKRASGDRAAFYHDPGTARSQSHGGSVYEFGDASAVSRIEEWSDGITEWWNDGNPILKESIIAMSKERRGYAAGLPANIGTGLVMFGDHERHVHLGVGQSRVRPTHPHRGRRGQCRFIADVGRPRWRIFRPRGSAYRIDLHSRRATNHVGAGER